MSPVTADGDLAGLALLAAAAALTLRSWRPARPRRAAPLPVSVEDRLPGPASLQLEESVRLGDEQDAVPQLGRSVAARDR